MDNLTHRLAHALGLLIEECDTNNDFGTAYQCELDALEAARSVHNEYDRACKEQGAIDHYAGREGG